MSYAIAFTPKAERQMRDVPPYLLDQIEEAFGRLASSPTTVSVPVASPPFPPIGQIYHFEAVEPFMGACFFTVIFQFSQDEATLHILSVTWRVLDD